MVFSSNPGVEIEEMSSCTDWGVWLCHVLCWKGRRWWEPRRWVGSVELWSGGLCNGPCGLYRMGGGELRRKSDRTRSQRIIRGGIRVPESWQCRYMSEKKDIGVWNFTVGQFWVMRGQHGVGWR